MPCCVAINCSNRSEKGWRLFRFPVGDRRAIWIQNLQRGDNWTPTKFSHLCEKHFEKSQFEGCRADGWKKLKPNAIPTIFDVPNSSPMAVRPLAKVQQKNLKQNLKFTRTTVLKQKKSISSSAVHEIPKHEFEFVAATTDESRISESEAEELMRLRRENEELMKQLEIQQANFESLQSEIVKLQKQMEIMDSTRRTFLSNNPIKVLE